MGAMAQQTVETIQTTCECGHQADFKVLPVGVKTRTPGTMEHRANAWLCCGRCLVGVLRRKMYSSYIVRMVD